jgi:hypothetical protein
MNKKLKILGTLTTLFFISYGALIYTNLPLKVPEQIRETKTIHEEQDKLIPLPSGYSDLITEKTAESIKFTFFTSTEIATTQKFYENFFLESNFEMTDYIEEENLVSSTYNKGQQEGTVTTFYDDNTELFTVKVELSNHLVKDQEELVTSSN